MLERVRPRLPLAATRWLLPLGIIAALAACATGISEEYNPTTPANSLEVEALAAADIKTIVIANVNLGSPSRNYLQREEERIDALVAARLRDAGYRILPSREFSQRWNNAILTYGNPVDPTTGRVNASSFVQIMQTVREQMVEQTDVDGFVFTDLLERDVVFTQGMSRVARWDGVTRKPALQGPGQGVSTSFDWGQPVAGVSLRVVLFNRELEKMFDGVGGMDITEAVDTRSGLGFVRRKEILENDSFVEEGISLALHPWLPMANWPGEKPAEE